MGEVMIRSLAALAMFALLTGCALSEDVADVKYVPTKAAVLADAKPVSLTVNEVEGAVFGVNVIPHTQSVTTLGRLSPGARVNLEIDQVARYVERLAGFGEVKHSKSFRSSSP